MYGKIIRSSMAGALIRERKIRLLLKWCWYKYIRRLDIIGFYAGVPIVRTKYLVSEGNPNSPSALLAKQIDRKILDLED